MKAQIQPGELSSMISQLKSFENQIYQISNSMNGYASSLGEVWQDPQYQSFLIQIQSMANQFRGNQQSLNALATQLDKLKSNLEETIRNYNSRSY
jgi:hypothetical protein